MVTSGETHQPTRRLRPPLSRAAGYYKRFARGLGRRMPKGLFPRSLLIIVMPMVILQSVIAFVFLERHWELVTRRLSEAVTRDISGVIEIINKYPQDANYETLTALASEKFGLSVSLLPDGPLPPPAPKPFFSLLDRTLSQEVTRLIGKPFWIDTIGRSGLVEIRIKLEGRVLRVFARRSKTYASNSHIFILWMVGTSLVLLTVAIIFLRNQIRPIQRLAAAAESFGKGRPIGEFRPSGAREVRRASESFLEMRRRIERQIDQRTTMLAGVSHDLRTILTRFQLQLALIGDDAETKDLKRDVDEMQAMLQAYLDFARGDSEERAEATDISTMLDDLTREALLNRCAATFTFDGVTDATVRPNAFKRCLSNLVINACRHAEQIEITGLHRDGWLTVHVDDNGPGIPPEEHENVFRPFLRLDEARNQDSGGTGLGLAIARDISRVHGGDISLSSSPLGGLRATVRIPG